MPAFAITGTADFSNITNALEKLNSTMANIKPPAIKVQEPNFSNFFSACDKAEARTLKIKAEIDQSSIGAGFNSFLGSEKGKFANVGKELGQSLTFGMQQQFGMAGGVATSFAGALGGVGLAAAGVVAGVGLIGAAATKAAMSWEDMKTSIGRTTGLEGAMLEDLMNQLQDVRQEMGITADTARGLVEQAGSIGVGQARLNRGDMAGYKTEILDFAKTTAMLQGAWGMSADKTAEGIGKMGSVTLGAWNMQRTAMNQSEMSWSEYATKVGGKVDALANAYGSTEDDIVTAMKNASSAVASYAPDEESYEKWLALSSFLVAKGSSSGEAGTQIERMAKGAKQHGDELAAILGMDKEGFNAALQEDFVGTFQNVAEELASMPESERPDMIKLLGIEGSGAMDKMVADIKTGVKDLQNSIDLKPTDITEGWDDVADNASKAFDRIAQAAQVSLEKIGGLLLPIVTDFANAVADEWQLVNTAGTEISNAVSNVASNGLGMTINGQDYTLDLSGLHKVTEEEKAAADAQKAAAEEQKKAAEAQVDAQTEAQKTAEDFNKSQEEYIKSMSSGGYSLSTMQQMNSQQSVNYGIFAYKNTPLASTNFTGLSNYGLQRYARASDKSGIIQVTDASGNIIKSESYTSDAEFRDLSKRLRKAIEPSILDLPKYMSSVDDQLSGELANILDDGVVEFTEKETLADYIKSLDELETSYPVEFYGEGLDDLRQQLEDAASGIPVSLDTGEMETNFALWLAENASAYSTMKTTGGITSYEADERAYFDAMQNLTDREKELLGYIDTAATSGAYEDIEVLPEVIDEIGKTKPELLGLTAVQNRLKTAEEAYADQVVQTGDTFKVIDENGNAVADAHLRSSVAAEILSGGLTSSASYLSNLASAANAAAAALRGISGNYNTAGLTAKAGVSNWLNSISKSQTIGSGSNSLWTPTVKYKIAETDMLSGNSGWLNLKANSNLPKLAAGGKVTSEGLAWVGEKGTEYVIPESEIKGLYAESVATAAKGSIGYYLNDQWFEDLAPTITMPTSYRWSQFPNAPNVAETNTDAIQRAWLSEDQKSTADVYSGQIRAAQLASIGQSQVMPWFARGASAQPAWWTEAAIALSPKYADAWAADKGGSVESLIKSSSAASEIQTAATKTAITVSDAWTQLYGESFTEGCISTNAPDASLQFTPSASLLSEIGYSWGADTSAAWNQLYGESFTEGCIAANKPDSLLRFTPSASLLAETARANGGAWGSQAVGSTGSGSTASSLYRLVTISEDALKTADEQLGITKDTKTIISTVGASSKVAAIGSTKTVSVASSGGSTGYLVTGLSEDGYVVTYDPRTDTCEGLAFNPPDPSLKTTDPFYLGITSGDLVSQSYDEGYGWGGRVGWTDDPVLQAKQTAALSALEKSSDKTEENTKQTADNTNKIATDVSASINGGSTSTGYLVAGGGGGGSSIIGLANRGGGTYWGGTSINGGGAWVGGGSTSVGGSGYVSWGGTAASNAASSGSSGSWGSVQWAEGGFADRPTWGVFGEAGREAFVPISDRAAGLRILPRVMQELGVRAFASGGMVGKSGGSLAGGVNLGGITVINNSKSAVNEKKLAKEIMQQAEAKFYKARRT